MKTVLQHVMACAAWGVLAAGGTAIGTEPSLEGRWKLVIVAFGEANMGILEIKEVDGKLTGDAVALPTGAELTKIEQEGKSLTLAIQQRGSENVFTGRLFDEGDDAGRVLGIYRFSGTPYPARLEKTEDDKVSSSAISAKLSRGVSAAQQEKDPATRVEKLEELLNEFPGPASTRIYQAILNSATDAELSSEQINEHLKNWFSDAEKYGESWVRQCRTNAIQALAGQKPYAELTLDLAQQAERALGKDASLEEQAAIVALLASAARSAGKSDLAASAEARSARLESALDDEYHRTVPPFAPEIYAGRDSSAHNRVVLMELFTGAQCPPCVAADVGFDALLKTYQPTELVTLQYHLHIPGPDPLTNLDTVARSKYYAVRGTPSTYFNGASEAYGGGGMTGAKAKYDQYREIIDARLKDTRKAQIALSLTRSGDSIIVTGTAEALLPPAGADAAEAKDKPAADRTKAKREQDDGDKKEEGDNKEEAAQSKQPKLRLRLALCEESIRYVGGNKLRFHHHVVRAMPGGVDGLQMTAGQCQVNQTVDLATVRKSLEEYLSSDERTYPKGLPEIRLEGLSLVAFVQDDSDKSVWHAVMLPVPESK